MKQIEERFWEKVDIRSEDECWEWQAYRHFKRQYGRFRVNSKSEDAHRIAWQLTNGEIPEGIEVCHTCDNPPCVNPNHLFLGTHNDNMQDMFKKGRWSAFHGSSHPRAILNEKDVEWIRSFPKPKHGEGVKTYKLWAKKFGCSVGAIENVVSGRNWR